MLAVAVQVDDGRRHRRIGIVRSQDGHSLRNVLRSRNNDRPGRGAPQGLFVLRVGKEADLVGTGVFQRGDAHDLASGVALDGAAHAVLPDGVGNRVKSNGHSLLSGGWGAVRAALPRIGRPDSP